MTTVRVKFALSYDELIALVAWRCHNTGDDPTRLSRRKVRAGVRVELWANGMSNVDDGELCLDDHDSDWVDAVAAAVALGYPEAAP